MTNASSSAKASTVLEAVLDFIRMGNLQSGSRPGFAHALKVSYNTMSKDRLTVDDSSPNTLTYRYQLSSDIPRFSVGLLSGLMDELTTNACFRVGQPSAPGVSLQMHTEWLVDPQEMLQRVLKHNHNQEEETSMIQMDIVSTVTKLGRTVSYTGADYICPATGQLLAHSTHVKYMPTGSWFMDQFLTNPFWFRIGKRLLHGRTTTPDYYPETPLVKDVIDRHLEYNGLGQATFHITREHTNPHGSMHGGCHAMVMERVGLSYAKVELLHGVHKDDENNMEVVLVSQHIDFLRAAKGSVEVVCKTLANSTTTRNSDNTSLPPQQRRTLHVQVTIHNSRNGKILSDGKLRFTVCPKLVLSSKL